jgi:hypothetical protein
MQDSIWYYKYHQFKEYIRTVTDKSITLPEALGTFRELKCLPSHFKQMTVGELASKDNSHLILELFEVFRKRMQPESRSKLPFNKKEREQELILDIVAKYNRDAHKIDIENARAKVVTGHYPPHSINIDNNTQVFNYWLEVVIAPLASKDEIENAGRVKFIGNINGTPSIDGGERYFQGGEYHWTNKQGHLMSETSISGILHECGFNRSISYSRRRKSSVVFVNLMTPCPDWLGSAGKTHIDLAPYQDMIAKTVSSLAYKIPSLHGMGIETVRGDNKLEAGGNSEYNSGVYIPYLRDFLTERRKTVEADSTLKTRDRLTQSGVWYRVRPKMIAGRFKPRKRATSSKGQTIYDWGTTRVNFTDKIRKVIEELWPGEDITREYLGIVAKARAMLYFNGQVYPVSFDSIDDLAKTKTTDLIIIEKEGITDVLLDFAKKYRIALVATGGNFTEYVKDLMRLAIKIGLNVCVITDYDIHGINIWRSAGVEVKRLGITRHVVTWLQENSYAITELDVEEEYQPNPKVFVKGEDDPYLLTKRIELDSIIQKVGAEGFWKYIVHRLELEFPAPRDYSDVVPEPEPENYYPDEVKDLLDYLQDYVKGSYSDEWTTIKKQELTKVNELLQVEEKQEEIHDTLKPIVAANEDMKVIVAKLKELMPSLPMKLKKGEKEGLTDNSNSSR